MAVSCGVNPDTDAVEGAGVDTGDLRSKETGNDPDEMRCRGGRESPPENLGQGDSCDKRSKPYDEPRP